MRVATPKAAEGYVIGVADVLKVIVWKEPDLALDATVRADGMITFPLLGDIEAAGMVPSKLAEAMAKRLEKFVEAPKVTVWSPRPTARASSSWARWRSPASSRWPAAAPCCRRWRWPAACSEFAKSESIVIVREDQTVIPVNYKRIAEGKDVSQNVQLTGATPSSCRDGAARASGLTRAKKNDIRHGSSRPGQEESISWAELRRYLDAPKRRPLWSRSRGRSCCSVRGRAVPDPQALQVLHHGPGGVGEDARLLRAQGGDRRPAQPAGSGTAGDPEPHAAGERAGVDEPLPRHRSRIRAVDKMRPPSTST